MANAWLLFFAFLFLVWLFSRKRHKSGNSLSPKDAAGAGLQQDLQASSFRKPGTIFQAKITAPIRWIAPSEIIDIGGMKISGGMVYSGTVAANNAASREYAHVIDPAAPVHGRESDVAGSAMTYWPAYGQIRPRERRGYLEWLAGGRRDPRFGIGYVFLFFYGLERRIFADHALQDARSILAEVEALKAVYGGNGSFVSYADRFTAALRLASGEISSAPPLALKQQHKAELPLDFRIALGRRLTEGRLPGDWLLAWYLGHAETALKTPQTRCFDEFCRLFQMRFAARYPKGLNVRLPAKRLKLTYLPASGTPAIAIPGSHEEWPDPAALSAPLKIAKGLADECTDALGSYSRYLGRYPAAKDTPHAQLLLPRELLNSAAFPFQKLMGDLDALIPNGAGEVSLAKLLELTGLVEQKPAGAALKTLSRVLAMAGLGMEPDPAVANGILPGLSAVIFKASGGAPVESGRPAYAAARLLVEASAVAAALNTKSAPSRFEFLWGEVERLPGMLEAERLRLLALLTSFRNNVPNQNRLLKRLSSSPHSEGESIALMVMRTIGTGPAAEVAQIAFAEKLYMALDLPKERVYSDLQKLSGEENERFYDDLVVVTPAAQGAPGIPIPPDPLARSLPLSGVPAARTSGREKTLNSSLAVASGNEKVHQIEGIDPIASGDPSIIDFTKLNLKRQETEEASGLLHRIFAESDAEMVFVNDIPLKPQEPEGGRFPGLESDYVKIIDLFLERNGRLGRSEFEALSTFPDGTLEAINDWAYSHFDELLIEDGEPMVISPHLLSRLRESV
ncbi:MAG: TerB N-terminal domain-containing protein [Rhodomicrobium sp.]